MNSTIEEESDNKTAVRQLSRHVSMWKRPSMFFFKKCTNIGNAAKTSTANKINANTLDVRSISALF